jgi:large subunit ribosomal protein L25
MATVPFSASTRGTTGKGVARKLRAAGQVPAVIYGHARQSQPLALDHHTLTLFLEKHPYQSTVIALNVDGKTTNTLIREVQRHPYKKQILHVDFQELVAGETITVPVPLHFTGVPEGVRLGGGMLDQILHELELDCDPTNIPGHINVDVTSLTIGHSIHAGEIVLPAGVALRSNPDATVCVCAAPRVETPAAGTAGAAGAEGSAGGAGEPELIRKPKAEDGTEAK